jgi:hypothetical protein
MRRIGGLGVRLCSVCLAPALVATVLAAGCAQQPIETRSPLYVLVDDGGNLTVDVLNQSDYRIAGKIVIASVGDMPPPGALAAQPNGRVLVTYSGVANAQQLQLKPSTVACSLVTARCDTVWSGWGSATARTLDDSSVVVPGWDDVHLTSGKLGFFGGQSPGFLREVPLPKSMPGPVAVSGDGRDAYWLTYAPPDENQTPEQQLLRVDTSSGKILGQVRFGKRLPFDVAVARDGKVLVSILYDQAPLRPTEVGAAPSQGVFGSSVLAFSPDLSSSRVLRVHDGPTLIAASRSILMVASSTTDVPGIGLYDLNSGSPKNSPPVPQGWKLSGLYVINLAIGGEVGVVVLDRAAHDHFQLGILSLSTGAVTWHEYPGQIVGSVAA